MVRSRINPRDVAERYCVAFCRFGGSLLSTKRARDDARRCTCSNVDSTASPRAEYCSKRKNVFISRLRRCTLSTHEFKPLGYRGRVVIIGPNKHIRRIVLSWKISQCRNTTFEVCLGKLGSRTEICLEKVLLTNKVMVKQIFPIGSCGTVRITWFQMCFCQKVTRIPTRSPTILTIERDSLSSDMDRLFWILGTSKWFVGILFSYFCFPIRARSSQLDRDVLCDDWATWGKITRSFVRVKTIRLRIQSVSNTESTKLGRCGFSSS